MASYEKGDPNADEVALFQAAIGIAADGKFGDATVKAVKAWQKANGMTADGMVGPDMLAALGLMELLIVEPGDEGTLVRGIQTALGIKVDGIYGNQTKTAVRDYQKKNKLKASGSADVATLKHMGVLGGASAKPAAPAAPPPPAPKARQTPQQSPVIAPAQPASSGATHPPRIASWAYQLADINAKEIASLPVDLVVIDYAADGDEDTAFKPHDLAAMKARPDGGSKKVVSYMSIGEAEDYRYYWNAAWADAATRPAWLDDLNPEWEGNYKVRYWDPEWQAVIMGHPDAYLDKIIAAGFDGVYLDIIDAFEYWRDEKPERPGAARDMIAFVMAIAAYARRIRPDFLVIPQNGEALLEDPAYRRVISAQGKEDIFYGQDGDGKANDRETVEDCLAHLRLATEAGIPVLAIEYLKDKKKIETAAQRLEEAGCCRYFGPRDLADIPLGQFRA